MIKLFENFQDRNLLGYDSETNAYLVEDYPYGFRQRTQIRYWIETTNRGDRFCSQTKNPKSGRWNKPKKSTYQTLGAMYLDDQEHVAWRTLNNFSNPDEVIAFLQEIGGEDKLTHEQLNQLKLLRGEKVETKTKGGKVKKDYTVRFLKNYRKTEIIECVVKFNRPDNVTVREIIDALKGTDQKKLNTVFDNDGTVRIKVDKGYQIGTISRDFYETHKNL
jgi:hypothetical protein